MTARWFDRAAAWLIPRVSLIALVACVVALLILTLILLVPPLLVDL